ncbi:YtcA family lipoprotein [Kosakonia radicincitans]|uniref:YtcA family lipoprotein n=1 Tax=Kosakonia radicincitans TaxID=283686 RepID=UPI0031D50B15
MIRPPGKFSSCCYLTFFFISTSILTGCSPAPSVVFFGASFPDWLLCSVIGVAGMTLLHVLSRRSKNTGWLSPAVIVYPCVTALISMLTWLLFFPS